MRDSDWARLRRELSGAAEFGDIYFPNAIYTVHSDVFGDSCVLGKRHSGNCYNLPEIDEYVTEIYKKRDNKQEIA